MEKSQETRNSIQPVSDLRSEPSTSRMQTGALTQLRRIILNYQSIYYDLFIYFVKIVRSTGVQTESTTSSVYELAHSNILYHSPREHLF
jgi:hypothetical protein